MSTSLVKIQENLLEDLGEDSYSQVFLKGHMTDLKSSWEPEEGWRSKVEREGGGWERSHLVTGEIKCDGAQVSSAGGVARGGW